LHTRNAIAFLFLLVKGHQTGAGTPVIYPAKKRNATAFLFRAGPLRKPVKVETIFEKSGAKRLVS
jgi:hypothetical protein